MALCVRVRFGKARFSLAGEFGCVETSYVATWSGRHGNQKERGNMTAYEWKISGLYKVDAQTAGEEFDRIYSKHGALNPSDVVEESRPKTAPLHDCFEWNDRAAADKYREIQARHMIQAITVTSDEMPQEPVRAFVSVEKTYRPISVVLESKDMTDELLNAALRELRTFELKYRNLQQLAPVFEAIERVA